MEELKIIRLKHQRYDNPERERIAWTKAAVQGVDRLPFSERDGETPDRSTIYLRDYLAEVFGLTFKHTRLWPDLEYLRQVRNHIIHRSLEVTISGDTMKNAATYLGNFPTILVQEAAKAFPEACTEGRPEGGDDGTPAYVLLEDYM